MTKYAKFGAQIVATILAAILAALTGDGVIDPVEWVNVAVLAVGAAGVFASPNVPGSRYTKVALSVLAGVLTVLTSAIIGGIDVTEWIQIAMAALGALGVYALPNKVAGVNISDTGAVGEH